MTITRRNVHHTRWLLVALLAALLALSGCIALGVSQEMSHSAVTVPGTPSVTLDTFNGNVEVTTGPAGKVSAGITKRTANDAGKELIKFDFSQSNTQVRGRCEWTGSGQQVNVGCDLAVQVPAGSDVEIMTGNGNVTYRATPGKTLNISTGSGNVAVTLPPDAQFTLRAATGSGEVKNAFALAQATAQEKGRVVGTVGGDPALSVMLAAGNGNITIERGQ